MSMESSAVELRRMSIAQWHALARDGPVPPMRIFLEGDSMRPLIRRGRDRVTIVPLTRPLKRGDVVLFEFPPGRYVVHRVYRLRDGFVQTLGDHCWNPDPWMPERQVLGQVVQAERDRLRIPLDSTAASAFGRFWMALLPGRRAYFTFGHWCGVALRRMGLRGGEGT